jgi:gluconolactonase
MSWFPPLERINAEIFTGMPGHFRRAKRSDWADANKGGAQIDSFLEGPSFDLEGFLYVTDIPHGRVFRISPDGDWSLVAEYDGWPNGLKIGPDGRIIITDYKKGLMRLAPQAGAVEPYYVKIRSESFKGVNDLVFARNGDIYFTDQGQTGMQDPSGRVYRLTADGRLEKLIDNCPSPNGIALDVEEKHLFVALTRACQIWRAPITRDGVLGKVGVFAHTPGGVSGPDGLAINRENGLIIANPGHGCAWVTDRFGVPLFCVLSPTGRTVTNVAFSPANPHMLYMTESETGHILRARLPVAGHLLASHQGSSHEQR